MTKAELVSAVSRDSNLPKKQLADIVDEVFRKIMIAVAGGDRVVIQDFGIFETKQYSARKARNPQNRDEIIEVPAKAAPLFRAGKGFKILVQESSISQ